MSDVFYLRDLEPAVTKSDVSEMAISAGGCFNLHRVDWHRSLLAMDGSRMLCWYQAPDSESVRNALRQLGSDMNKVWSAAGNLADLSLDEVNLVVEASAATFTLPDSVNSLVQSAAEVQSMDGRQRLLLLCCDSAAVASQALSDSAAGTDVRCWACEPINPNDL